MPCSSAKPLQTWPACAPAPLPAGTGWQRPHQDCPFKSLPPLIVWTNPGPYPPPRQAARHPLPTTSPQKCEDHLKGQQRQPGCQPPPEPAHTLTAPLPSDTQPLPPQKAPQIPVLSPPLETARRKRGARVGGRGIGGARKRQGPPPSFRAPGDRSEGKQSPEEQ